MVGPSINTHNNLSLKPPSSSIKFLCSYGGKILPRYPDGKLRYHGGHTRVLSVNRSISFAELLAKLREMCGTPSVVSLRCQLPTEDLDALVSITSDEDLANLVEEYDRVAAASEQASSIKIRVFISAPRKSAQNLSSASSSSIASSSSSSTATSNDSTSPSSNFSFSTNMGSRNSSVSSCSMTSAGGVLSRPVNRIFPWYYHEKSAAKLPQCAHHGYGNGSRHMYAIHNGNHWQ